MACFGCQVSIVLQISRLRVEPPCLKAQTETFLDQNKNACQVDFTRAPAQVSIVKPKVWLTCQLHLPANSWVNLSI